MEREQASSREDLILTALEEVGKAADTMRDLMARLEDELQAYRARDARPVLNLVVSPPSEIPPSIS